MYFLFFFYQITCEGQVHTAVQKEVISGLHLFLKNACFQLLDHKPEVENEPPPSSDPCWSFLRVPPRSLESTRSTTLYSFRIGSMQLLVEAIGPAMRAC